MLLKLPGEFGKYTAASGDVYGNGSTIELPEDEAERLTDSGLALPNKGPADADAL